MCCSYIADCQIPKACLSFVEKHGEKIVKRTLCRNFVMHLTNLYDFGLIKPDVVRRTVMQLFKLRDRLEHGEDHRVMTNSGVAGTSSRSHATSTSLPFPSTLSFYGNKRAFKGIHSSTQEKLLRQGSNDALPSSSTQISQSQQSFVHVS